MNKKALKQKYKHLFHEVRGILFHHDPVGINFGSNTDEYDPEVGTILVRLHAASSVADVHAIVHEEFVRWFGESVAGQKDDEAYQASAEEIWAAWRQYANRQEFPLEFLAYLQAHTLVGIKGGAADRSFLDIWMVEVDGRVFARSWAKSARSWFTAFQAEGVGQIRYGGQVLDVRGLQADASDRELMTAIDAAYLKKYVQAENVKYAEGIAQKAYWAYTMEFLLGR